MKVNGQYMCVVCGICMLWEVGSNATTGVTWIALTVINMAQNFFL